MDSIFLNSREANSVQRALFQYKTGCCFYIMLILNIHSGRLKISMLTCLMMAGLLAGTACSPAGNELFPKDEAKRPVPVYLRSHGWHVGILLPVNEQFADVMPDGLHINSSTQHFAELGWGDRHYYMNPDPGLWSTLKAGVWPTASVLHVAGYGRRPRMQEDRAVRVMLSEAGYEALLQRAASYFELNEPGGTHAAELAEGLYGDARFYGSHARYYFPKTSNRWVAALLEEAGAPINSFTTLSAGTLLRRSRSFGHTVENSP
jgi:uncharacterized protein (TIGR02117 family)